MRSIFKQKKTARILSLLVTAGMAGLLVLAAVHDGTEPENLFPALALCIGAGLFCLLRRPAGVPGIVCGVIGIIVIPLLSVWVLQYYTLDPFRIYPMMLLVNYAFYFLFFLMFSFLAGSFSVGYTIAGFIFMAIGILNFFVVDFRSSPIVPWDIFSIRTAASVANHYKFQVTWRFFFATSFFVCLIIAGSKIPMRIRRALVRIIGAVLCAALLGVCGFFLQKSEVKEMLGMDTILFTPNVRYRNNGFLSAFIGEIHLIYVSEPAGYSPEKAQEIIDRTLAAQNKDRAGDESSDNSAGSREAENTGGGNNEKDGAPEESGTAGVNARTGSTQLPNIIVVMNEAFSDLSVLGDFETDQDYMPFMRSLIDKGYGGELMVSVRGGNTANTEYEFLAGDTMAFLPEGSVVYQQFIHDNVPALPSILAGLGYETTAIHPYLATGWERDRVYNELGFMHFLSISDFTDAIKLRGYVSDQSAFEKITSLLENDEEMADSQFIFEVTMQNHGGYSKDYEGFSASISLEGLAKGNTQTRAVEKYLTLLKISDDELEKLVQWLEDYDEPVILITFGDHQPSDYISNVITRMTGFDPEKSLEEQQKLYIVPYVVWNNYDLKMDLPELLSVNYLAAAVMEQAGMPLTPYQRYLNALRRQLPVVCSGAYMDNKGNYYLYGTEEYEGLLNGYNILQYNHLIDDKNRLTDVFLRAE